MSISPILLISVPLVVVGLVLAYHRFRARGVATTFGILVAAGVGAWLLPPLAIPADRSVGWVLGTGTAGTTTVPLVVDWPNCEGGEWLASPSIVYTPWSVTITMATNDVFAANSADKVGWCLSGKAVEVQLSEPLDGRQLFDGSWFPAHARSVGDPMRSFAE